MASTWMVKALQPTLNAKDIIVDTCKASKTLARALTIDNVQPQAFEAAERLGHLLHASPQRIQEAIGALGGNEHVLIPQWKVWVGLRSGGIRAHFRESTPLIKLFLLCTACNLCFDANETGQILSAMVIEARILDSNPVNAKQLSRLVRQLSGHANAIMPQNPHLDVTRRLNDVQSGSRVQKRLPFDELGKLLVTLFSELGDESTESIKISGILNGAWLATALTWLLGEDVYLTVDNEPTPGEFDDRNARVHIDIELPQSSQAEEDGFRATDWNMSVFKHGSDPQEYIFLDKEDGERGTLIRIPLSSTVQNLKARYWSDLENEDKRNKAPELCGIIAAASIQFMLSKGRIRNQDGCCYNIAPACKSVPIGRIASPEFVADIDRVLEKYGWTARDFQRSKDTADLVANMKTAYRRVKQSYGFQSSRCTGSPSEGLSKWKREVTEAYDDVCYTFLRKHEYFGSQEQGLVFDAAIFVAVDAIMTCTAQFGPPGNPCCRFIRPLEDPDIDEYRQWLDYIISGSLTPSIFHSAAFCQLLPGLNQDDPSLMVVQRDGLVVGWSSLWTRKLKQNTILGIYVAPGDIKYKGHSYDQINEVNFHCPAHGQPCPATPKTLNSGQSYKIKNPFRRGKYRFDTSVNASDAGLKVKTCLVADLKTRTRSSLIQGIYNLALATHVGERDIGVVKERAWSVRAYKNGNLYGLEWVNPLYGIPYLGAEQRIIVPTWKSSLLKLTVAGALTEAQHKRDPGQCAKWYALREGGSIMQVLGTPDKKLHPFVLIA